MTVSKFELDIPFETKKIELKRILNDGPQAESWLKTVAGFANGEGGDIYVGVNDVRESVGLTKDLVDKQVQLFHRNVKAHLAPLPKYDFSYHQIAHNLYVIQIHIHPSQELPVVLSMHGIPSIYVREEGQNRAANREEIVNLVLRSNQDKFDVSATKIKYRKEDFSHLFATFENRNGYPLNDKILLSHRFFDEDGNLRQGALLFKDDYQGNLTALKVTRWFGFSKGDNSFQKLLDIKTNILQSIDEVMETIRNCISYVEIKMEEGRKSEPDYPLRSVFEGVVNAFAHKNYYYEDSIIEIDLFLNRLEITSPGGMINHIFLNEEKDIANILPTRRNEIICEILNVTKYMEKEGSGFDKISRDYARMPEKKKPFVTSKENYFILTLPNIHFAKPLTDEVNNPPITCFNYELLTKKQRDILSYCYFKPRTIEEIASFLKVSISTHLRKNILYPLVDSDLLIRNDDFKADLYYSNHDLVKLA